VFVSYVQESRQHQHDVLAFASFLRGQGVDAVLDVWSADARHDWYAWAIREMTGAEYVIVVASPMYGTVGDGSGPADRYRGVQSEATLLRDLLHGDRATWMPRILPVLLPGHGIESIPLFLSPHTHSHFRVEAYTVVGAEALLRVIHGRPGHVPPPVLPPPELPSRSVPVPVVWRAGMPVETGRRPGAVEVHLVPGERMGPYSAQDVRRALSDVASRISGDVGNVRLDPSESAAWVTSNDTGLIVLREGQRSAEFALPASGADGLVAALADHIQLLTEVGLPCPAAWIPAAGFASARRVLSPVANSELRSFELAAHLAADLPTSEREAPVNPSRVTNVVNGEIRGKVIQAGDIQGGVHF
jgi:hypothetical protein